MRWLTALAGVSLGVGATAPDFTRDIRPVLQKKCWACHGAAQQMNGLRLDEGEAALKGGYSGAVIVPGSSATSKLVERVTSTKDGFRMPPAGPRLTEGEVAALKAWIDGGARWPAGPKAAVARPKSNHWAFQAVKRPAVPQTAGVGWVRNPVDAFVAARLAQEGIKPSPEADKATLLARISLDLTGLPPTPEEVREFLADRRADAYERAVERLLASPHYGERWGRVWLDLAHYADSDGYEKDQVRGWAWRYRDWVIQALNRDLPFDRFTVEQLAGDLLPGAGVDQRVATGFLRQTLTNREAGVDREEAHFEQLVNRVNTVSTVWLGLTMGCAQCHNHKYDPLSQKDYYSMLGFFERAREVDIDAPLAGEVGPYLAAQPEYRKKRQALLAEYEVPVIMPQWEAKLVEAIDRPGSVPEWDFALTSMKAMFDHAVRVLKTPRAARTERDQTRLEDYMIRNNFTSVGLDKAKMERLKELRKRLDEIEALRPPFAQAYAVEEDPEAPPTAIRVRGDWKQKGIVVEAETPAVLPPLKAQGKATRLDLARWLVSAENPLTARVVVNRVWQEYFGRGIVKTSEDFGVMGDKPTHPELLDWLASEFVKQEWSLKKLSRLIVTSATYRQSAAARAELVERDPENTLLARQVRLRLPAELVRDRALAASGLLNRDVGGRSVRPPQPAGVAELGYAGSVKWVASTGRDRYRRGLYIHFQRTTPYPMLMSFDAPDSNVACTRRARSNTALQSLNLLNDEVFYEAAQALAWRIEREAPGDVGGRLDYAFRLALGRAPTTRELERLARYHDEQEQILRREGAGGASGLTSWVGVSRVLLNLDEFITRE